MRKGKYTEVLIPFAIKREKGYLYFIDKEGNVCRAMMRSKIREMEKRK